MVNLNSVVVEMNIYCTYSADSISIDIFIYQYLLNCFLLINNTKITRIYENASFLIQTRDELAVRITVINREYFLVICRDCSSIIAELKL